VRPDRVALKLDKPAYADGETAKLTITPPHAGEALITVEGDKLLWSRRISLPADGKHHRHPGRQAEWKRHDLYVTAMVLRPGSAGEKGGAGVTPARALGLAYLPLERGNRKLSVAMEAPKKMAPDQPLKVKVKVPEAKGQSRQWSRSLRSMSASSTSPASRAPTRTASSSPSCATGTTSTTSTAASSKAWTGRRASSSGAATPRRSRPRACRRRCVWSTCSAARWR
jgi:hypothetical protein